MNPILIIFSLFWFPLAHSAWTMDGRSFQLSNLATSKCLTVLEFANGAHARMDDCTPKIENTLIAVSTGTGNFKLQMQSSSGDVYCLGNRFDVSSFPPRVGLTTCLDMDFTNIWTATADPQNTGSIITHPTISGMPIVFALTANGAHVQIANSEASNPTAIWVQIFT